MAIYKNDIIDIEMENGGIHKTFYNLSIGKNDEEANRIGVRIFRNGQDVVLTGVSCIGYFTDSQGNRITMVGMVDWNLAYVTLTDECYENEGKFRLAIKLTDGSVTTTVRIVDGMVENT